MKPYEEAIKFQIKHLHTKRDDLDATIRYLEEELSKLKSSLPDNAISYGIYAIVPCQGKGKDWGCDIYPYMKDDSRCPGCRGDGTRVKVTDMKVERDNRPIYGEDSVRWIEVSSA